MVKHCICIAVMVCGINLSQNFPINFHNSFIKALAVRSVCSPKIRHFSFYLAKLHIFEFFRKIFYRYCHNFKIIFFIIQRKIFLQNFLISHFCKNFFKKGVVWKFFKNFIIIIYVVFWNFYKKIYNFLKNCSKWIFYGFFGENFLYSKNFFKIRKNFSILRILYFFLSTFSFFSHKICFQ